MLCTVIDLKSGTQFRCSVRVCRNYGTQVKTHDSEDSYGNNGCGQRHLQSGITQKHDISGYDKLGRMPAAANTQGGHIYPFMHVQRPFTWNQETSLIGGFQSVAVHVGAGLCVHEQSTAFPWKCCNVGPRYTHTVAAMDGGMYTSVAIDVGMHLPRNFAWNREISSHVRSQQGKLAMLTYNRMLQESAIPDKTTYIFLLSIRVSSLTVLKFAKQLHSLIRSLGNEVQSDIMLGNVLISIYGRCDRAEYAQMVFLSLCERNVVSWNAMISVCVQQGRGQQALHLFDQMKQEGITGNTITFVSSLHACSSESALQFGTWLHACVVAWGSVTDVFLNTALISMYGKCGCIEKAERLFEEMPERNVISWNTMISAYAQHGQGSRVFALFHQLQKVSFMPTIATFVSIISTFSSHVDLLKGKRAHASVAGEIFDSNISIGTALIGMYRRCGSVTDARSAFDAMRKHDQGSWNAMVATYVQYNQGHEAFQLFAHMQLQGVLPNKTTHSSILSTCSLKTALFEGMRLHAVVMNSSLQSDLLVGNALVSMYGKCGVLDKAQQVFDKMNQRNTVSWNAMLDAHALHGKADSVFQLFERMRRDEILPDMVTFTSMLTVCSRLGLVDEARNFLISMSRDYGLVPTRDHFNCVIDLLARAGKLDEAEDLLNKMPISHCAVSMRTLLGACRSQTDVERGERAAKQVIMLDPKNTSPYTILSNMYVVVDEGSCRKEVVR